MESDMTFNLNQTSNIDKDECSVELNKYFASTVLFSVAFVGGVSPSLLIRFVAQTSKGNERDKKCTQRRIRTNCILDHLQAFSGGCLLTLVFAHLVPELIEAFSHEQLIQSLPAMENTKAEVPGLVVLAGTLMLLWLETLVGIFGSVCRRQAETLNSSQVELFSEDKKKQQRRRYRRNEEEVLPLVLESSDLESDAEADQFQMQWSLINKKDSRKKQTKCSALSSALALLAAISFHSILEGVTLSTQNTCNSVWILTLSLSSHKWVVAMSLGSSLEQRKPLKGLATVLIVILFSFMTPFGCFMGGVVLENLNSVMESLGSLIIQGLSIGSLFYIAAFELLMGCNINRGGRKSLSIILSITLGVALVAILLLEYHEPE